MSRLFAIYHMSQPVILRKMAAGTNVPAADGPV